MPNSKLHVAGSLTTADTQLVNVVATTTATTGDNITALNVTQNFGPGAASAAQAFGLKVYGNAGNGNTAGADYTAAEIGGVVGGTATIDEFTGLRLINAYLSGANVNQAVGLEVWESDFGGTVTDSVGIFVEERAAGTNNYAIAIGAGASTDPSALPNGDFSLLNNSTLASYFAGSVGIGNTSPSAKLDVYDSNTLTTGFDGFLLTVDNTTASSTGSDYAGGVLQLNVAPATATTLSGEVTGIQGKVNQGGAGNVTTAEGVVGQVGSTSSGNITNAYALSAWSPYRSGAGTITNAVGLYIGNQSITVAKALLVIMTPATPSAS